MQRFTPRLVVNKKVIAMLSHLALGGVWLAVIFIIRNFFPDNIKSIIWFNSSFVFYSFILSFGFTTLARLLVYERNIKVLRGGVYFSLILTLLVIAISFFFLSGDLLYLFPYIVIYNYLFLYLNISIAIKNYVYVAIYSMLSLLCVFLGCVTFIIKSYELLTFSVTIFLFVSFYFKSQFNPKWCVLNFKFIASTLSRAPILLFAVMPLRGCIYLMGLVYSGEGVDVSDSVLYADLLIFQGVISIFIGRAILFNEKSIKNKLIKYSGVYFVFQSVIVTSFLIYINFFDGVNILLLLLSSMLLSSRESFGAFVNLAVKNVMYKVCFIYTLCFCVASFNYYYFNNYYIWVFTFPFILNSFYFSKLLFRIKK
ncbi:MAG TPA: hypothetical protein DEF74_03630 [Pseudoalteromonas sp.]|nr:hypothetical protein [Pseudoalteromonas sp.]|tara:strand:- start:8056 stop:9159 length:1104 start_codon:yes stop_codon:yes gene_type:complete